MQRRIAIATSLVALLLAACAPAPQTGLGDVSPPASGSSAAVQQYQPGERIKLDDEEYLTVGQVSTWLGTDFVKPQAGHTFVAIEVKLEGIDPNGASVDPFWFTLQDSDRQSHDLVDSGKDPMLQQTDALAPDTPAAGWVTFEIPASKGKGVDLIYAPPFAAPVLIQLD